MRRLLRALFVVPVRHHLFGSLAIVLGVAVVLSAQITDRTSFADSELRQDVMDRWGAPIRQPAPSVRYVGSGAVFNTLQPLPLAKQHVDVEASMNYRKRGLVYFSGFDFAFRGRYEVQNPEPRDVDLVFVFPIEAPRNQILLSDLQFLVDGKPTAADLAEQAALVWTGRVAPGQRLAFDIAFKGRGLDSFTYLLDPELRVNDFRLALRASGGANYDYPAGVVPAASTEVGEDQVALTWSYGSLESGVPVGLILPSEQAYDQLLSRMLTRSPVPFLLLFAGLVALGLSRGRAFKLWEAYLLAAGYGLFFVLLAYLAAFLSFYLAFALSLAAVSGLLFGYLRLLLGGRPALLGLALVAAFLGVPSVAVVLDGYTGLIYTLEIAGLVAALMVFTARPAFGRLVASLLDPQAGQEVGHAA
ncbi:MAG TPA: hypothetical protein PK668_24365 [Myxococcota bacterium]|nr:hypothetical protein [Myxococcota bacterium]HRY95395.1 hypothetical protein [Myxococcota bacterium]HSA21508.1 hypothetical protein [Myxococcota bacterium]